MSQIPLRPFRSQRPFVPLPSGEPRPIEQLSLGKQKLSMPLVSSRLKSTAPPPLQRQRAAAPQLSGRQSPMVPNRPTPSNYCMQHLEMEAIEEEGKDCLSFLIACGTALQASPPGAHGVLMTPFHLLMGNAPLATLLNISPWVFSTPHESTLLVPHSTTPVAPGPLPGSK